MKIAIYGRPANKSQQGFVKEFLQKLLKNEIEVFFYEPLYDFLFTSKEDSVKFFSEGKQIQKEVDFLICLGGDGTMLDAVPLVQNSGLPVLGVNTGRLGFLANIRLSDIDQAIESLLKGHYSLDKRTLIRLESNTDFFGENNYALNELTIHKRDTSSMITIHAYLNGEFLNSYWADGLLISTPTGSTGYSLSCGGPILMPQSESFVINPIAPHNLNVRPIIVSDKNTISIEIEGRSQHFLAALDSRSVTIDSSIQLAVKKEDFTFNLIRLYNKDFLDTLREKLMWGLDNRN